MKRLVLPLVVGLLLTAGVAARGDGSTFSVVTGSSALPSATVPNGSDLSLAPTWTVRPVQPVQLSYDQLLRLWQNAGHSYGIPWNVLAAINKIESNFGRNMGPSSAGAIGWMQFMPSTWERWGTDADANGFADPWNPVDGVYSAARYLAASGGATDIRRAVFSYNHADWYVNQVLQLAQLYGSSDTAPADAYQNAPAVQGSVLAPDPLQAELDEARAAVTKADAAYRAGARARRRSSLTRAQELTDSADGTRLLSNRLDAQKQAGQFGAEVAAAQAEADGLKQKLDEARAALTKLEQKARGSRPTASGAPGRRARATTSSRSAAARRPSPSRTTTTTIPPPTSPRPRARRSTPCPTGPSSTPGAGTSAAAPASRCRPPTARRGRTATCPSSSPP